MLFRNMGVSTRFFHLPHSIDVQFPSRRRGTTVPSLDTNALAVREIGSVFFFFFKILFVSF